MEDALDPGRLLRTAASETLIGDPQGAVAVREGRLRP
jgi:hypothetical protein